MRYIFQESQILEAGNPVDLDGKKVSIKARSEQRARRRLPDISFGRSWVLIETKEKETP